MPASHKAYVFDYDSFAAGLRPVLEEGLRTGRAEALRAFVVENRARLRDPYEGEPLEANWEALLETKDVHEYGDFALTMYYNPADDVGVGTAWAALEALLVEAAPPRSDLTPGELIGPPNNPFDPGRMGSYFLSTDAAQARLDTLRNVVAKRPDVAEHVEPLMRAYGAMVNSGLGGYVTF